MTSQARIDANRKNAAKSTGPRTDAGKARAKMNGLKHGLRSEEVVLPTENREEFESHLNAWMEDWQPPTETRRFLVERAATAAWRLKRIVRIENDRITTRYQYSMNESAKVRNEALDRLVGHIAGLNGVAALDELEKTRDGLDRIRGLWTDLADALVEPGNWCDLDAHHKRITQLLGVTHETDADDEMIAIVVMSWRLLMHTCPEYVDGTEEPVDDAEAHKLRLRLQEVCQNNLDWLKELWDERPDETAFRQRHAEAYAFSTLDDDKTIQRYEARLDREAKSSIKLLMQLQKTDADLNASEIEAPRTTEPNAPAPAPTEPNVKPAEASEAPTEPNEIAPETGVAQADRDRGGRIWHVEGVAEVAEGVENEVSPSPLRI